MDYEQYVVRTTETPVKEKGIVLRTITDEYTFDTHNNAVDKYWELKKEWRENDNVKISFYTKNVTYKEIIL